MRAARDVGEGEFGAVRVRLVREFAHVAAIVEQGRDTVLPGAEGHRPEMCIAHQGLEGRTESLYHPA